MAAERYWDIFPGSQQLAMGMKAAGQIARSVPGASRIFGKPGSSDPGWTERWGLEGAETYDSGKEQFQCPCDSK